ARGAKLCFVSQQPLASAQGARLAAHHAVQGGLDPKLAMAGLTSAPAEALGIADRVGSLRVGRHGDLLVLSGPPLDLRSEVLEVFVAGERVHRQSKETP
ncbi:MAG TPA: amidohydrolase, partial [Planctomycetes bacterium]|nr:amidohydrolase [Planctomycetota bacterium]